VYGPYDNFDIKNAMVIPSLIKKIIKSKKKLDVWGNGSQIRDFIFSEDVADGMILAVYKRINYPINIGSGQGVTIKSLVETIVKVSNKNKLKINWQQNKPGGDRKRLMDLTKARAIGFNPKISLREGIEKTVEWFLKNKFKNKRYNSFTEKS
jgi:GDP-L-fucose synthase